MERSLDNLSSIIRGQVESYEEKMSQAMTEGSETEIRKISEDFENEVGKNVCAFAKLAGEPIRSTLLSLFTDSCVEP
jgi:NADH:ubiquinone oxidoreductase subunit F (NADH-binding)